MNTHQYCIDKLNTEGYFNNAYQILSTLANSTVQEAIKLADRKKGVTPILFCAGPMDEIRYLRPSDANAYFRRMASANLIIKVKDDNGNDTNEIKVLNYSSFRCYNQLINSIPTDVTQGSSITVREFYGPKFPFLGYLSNAEDVKIDMGDPNFDHDSGNITLDLDKITQVLKGVRILNKKLAQRILTLLLSEEEMLVSHIFETIKNLDSSYEGGINEINQDLGYVSLNTATISAKLKALENVRLINSESKGVYRIKNIEAATLDAYLKLAEGINAYMQKNS